MYDCRKNYSNGEWTASGNGSLHDAINPATVIA